MEPVSTTDKLTVHKLVNKNRFTLGVIQKLRDSNRGGGGFAERLQKETTLPPLTFYTACDVMHNSSHDHSTINKLSLDLTLIYRGTLVYYGSSVTLTLGTIQKPPKI